MTHKQHTLCSASCSGHCRGLAGLWGEGYVRAPSTPHPLPHFLYPRSQGLGWEQRVTGASPTHTCGCRPHPCHLLCLGLGPGMWVSSCLFLERRDSLVLQKPWRCSSTCLTRSLGSWEEACTCLCGAFLRVSDGTRKPGSVLCSTVPGRRVKKQCRTVSSFMLPPSLPPQQ